MNRPPDPPDPNKIGEKLPECPSNETHRKRENGEESSTATESTETGDDERVSAMPNVEVAATDIAMEEATTTSQEVEVVYATQF